MYVFSYFPILSSFRLGFYRPKGRGISPKGKKLLGHVDPARRFSVLYKASLTFCFNTCAVSRTLDALATMFMICSSMSGFQPLYMYSNYEGFPRQSLS